VEQYDAMHRAEWDAFVTESKNGTFLFLRDYMDYHADRFVDHSLIIRHRSRILAVLPANRVGDDVHTHLGLTYGGIISCGRMTTPVMLDVFEAIVARLRHSGASVLHYKTVPWIYHRMAAEEDRYALFLGGAELCRRDVLSVVSPAGDRAPIQDRRRRAAAKAKNVEVARSHDWGTYWKLLSSHLRARFGAVPVHSLDEIERLHSRFSQNIKLYTAACGDEVLAGVVIYESHLVAHVQYIASSERGLEYGALDKLFLELIDGPFRDKRFFDFGMSNRQDGRVLNRGLIEQKEGFGARAVVHDFYRLRLSGK
jgi:hypothetical protein